MWSSVLEIAKICKEPSLVNKVDGPISLPFLAQIKTYSWTGEHHKQDTFNHQAQVQVISDENSLTQPCQHIQ
jgi:hypothetical protein